MQENNIIDVSLLPQNRKGVLGNQLIINAINRNYNLLNNNRSDYIKKTGIKDFYQVEIQKLHSSHINYSLNVSPLITQPSFLGVSYQIIPKFTDVAIDNLSRMGFVEFMQFFEKQIQYYIQISASQRFNRGEINSHAYNYAMTKMSDVNKLSNIFRMVNRPNNIAPDLKKIIDDVINLIQVSYKNKTGYLSKFLQSVAILQDDSDDLDLTRRRWTYRLRNNNSVMKILVAIVLLRFPSANVTDDLFDSLQIKLNFTAKRNQLNIQRTVKVEVLKENMRNLTFYYIPNLERVVGVYKKSVFVKEGAGNTPFITKNINYDTSLIKNCIIKIPVLRYHKLNFERIFEGDDNLYTKIRTMDPFAIGRNRSKRLRLYVSLSIYGNRNFPFYHIPWVVEGPLNSGKDHDYSHFYNEYLLQLENIYKDENDETSIDDTNEFYFHFSWIHDETNMDNTNNNPRINNRVDFYEYMDGELEIEEEPPDAYDNVIPIQPQIQNIIPQVEAPPADYIPDQPVQIPVRRARRKPPQPQPQPLRRSERIANQKTGGLRRSQRIIEQNKKKVGNRTNLRNGAPYVGTEKQKHFYDISMINKFTCSPALFKTPVTKLNLCLPMSLIRAQLYCYTFDQNKFIELKVTGTKHTPSKCNNMYVESCFNFDEISFPYSFLTKKDGSWFIKLFEPNKLINGHKYLEGCINKQEEFYWEIAAEEIWHQMENRFETEIDYNNVDEFCQYFCNFFKICISVYDIEIRANRVNVYSPFEMTPKEIVNKYGKILMVHIVIDQGHTHAISSFASFIKSDTRKDDLRLYNYCPICEKTQIQELKSSTEKSLEHITKCCLKSNFKLVREDKINDMMVANLNKIKYNFVKEGRKTKKLCQCSQCYQEIDQRSWMSHHCTIQKKKLNVVDDKKVYVYDLEASQRISSLGLLVHECNCLYIRKVYCENEEEEGGNYFQNEYDFLCDLVDSDKYKNCIFIAHNGGSYDVQFMLRILERKEIKHSFIPSPTSQHKFIQMLITHNDLNISFIDFMRFIPGSLKNIAESFQIKVAKGDFPHVFNNGENENYIGRIPPLESENDWWSLKYARNEKDLKKFKNWYAEQTEIYCTCDNECICNKMKWNFQTELKKYCLLDVVVLAEIVKAYRYGFMNFEINEEKIMGWEIPRIDPLQFLTLPQLALNILIGGYSNMNNEKYDFNGIYTLTRRQRGGKCDEAIMWLYELQKETPHKIFYLGNSNKEWYDFDLQMNIDGYCMETDTVYLYLDCCYWGCELCLQEFYEYGWKIPDRNMWANDVKNQLEYILKSLNETYTNVIVKWDHDFNETDVDPYIQECSNLFEPEDCFYGGRCEVFKPYAKAGDSELMYIDVTSLYPSCYVFEELPIGIPQHYIAHNIERIRLDENHPNKYFGFVKCHVIPNNKDLIGLLPKRDEETGRLFFPVYPMTGCWFTAELYLAVQKGYEITEIYEVYHWDERNRSKEHIKPYVDYFFRMKQESEGWVKSGASSENPTEEEKLEIQEKLYQQNGNIGKIRIEKVKLDCILRALAKLLLNTLWGKWAQKAAKRLQHTIYGSQQLLDLLNNPKVETKSCQFRETSLSIFNASYKIKDEFLPSVKHGNLFIAAAVTATARCRLHKKMIELGEENIIYCDTDSLVLKYKESVMGKITGVGLGQWTNEYPKHHISHFYGLAPKLYSLKLHEKKDGEGYETFRAKGVQLTIENQKKLTFDAVKPLIEDLVCGKNEKSTISVDNFNIFTNSTNNALPFGQVYTRKNQKQIRSIMSKRDVELVNHIDWENITEIQTFPFGYEHN